MTLMTLAFGDATVSQAGIFEWTNHFKEGVVSIQKTLQLLESFIDFLIQVYDLA
jgi:hypothetical protein